MIAEDIVLEVKQTVRKTAPELSAKAGVRLRQEVLDNIVKTVEEALLAEYSTIESVVRREKIDLAELHRATEYLVSSTVAHARKEGRDDIRTGDVTWALVELKWSHWPFCRPPGDQPTAATAM